MTMGDRITEAEAVSTAGVSARTLQRFQESGYLDVTTSSDGSKLYLRSQIVEIFGAAEALSTPPAVESETHYTTHTTETTDEPNARPRVATTEPRTPSALVDETAESTAGDGDERELQRLRNLVALQERILDIKDAEVTDLRSQRDWLRARIERLEEKAERDQILLLSETQTIRKLVSLNEGRRSAFQNILEWLGISKQVEVKTLAAPKDYVDSETVEVRNAANS
jgi:hypothetical protein